MLPYRVKRGHLRRLEHQCIDPNDARNFHVFEVSPVRKNSKKKIRVLVWTESPILLARWDPRRNPGRGCGSKFQWAGRQRRAHAQLRCIVANIASLVLRDSAPMVRTYPAPSCVGSHTVVGLWPLVTPHLITTSAAPIGTEELSGCPVLVWQGTSLVRPAVRLSNLTFGKCDRVTYGGLGAVVLTWAPRDPLIEIATQIHSQKHLTGRACLGPPSLQSRAPELLPCIAEEKELGSVVVISDSPNIT